MEYLNKKLKTPHRPLISYFDLFKTKKQTKKQLEFESRDLIGQIFFNRVCRWWGGQMNAYSGASMALCTVRAPGLSKPKQGWT